MKKILFSALCLMFFGCAFSEDNRYLNIVNNTDRPEVVTFGFSSNGIVLRAGESVEFICNGSDFTFGCSHGVMSHHKRLVEDTTLEMNPDCWYLGSEKNYYWTEGR